MRVGGRGGGVKEKKKGWGVVCVGAGGKER